MATARMQTTLTVAETRAVLELEHALMNGALASPALAGIFTRLRDAYYRAIPYDIYLRTRHWEQMRQMAMRSYGGRCQQCETKTGEGEAIHIHHLTYDRLGHEALTDVIPLCAICHARWHRDEEQWNEASR